MRASIPYPPPQDGVWSPVTSTLNWCEEDYYATVYAAEIVNTLTNLLFIYLGIKGLRSCRRNGHDFIFQVALVGYLVVGTGSFLFHATLTYPMQLVDELSMIYTTCLMCYATFSFDKSARTRTILGCGLTALSAFITLYYHYLQDPTFHQVTYAILTAVVLVRSMWIMEVTLRPSWYRAHKEPSPERTPSTVSLLSREQGQKTARDLEVLKAMWTMVAWGLFTFLGGFLFWNLDNQFCTTVKSWRHSIGLPWGVLLEGHGWWHILTATGAYMYITWGVWLRHCLNGRQEEYRCKWRRIYHFPDIVRVEKGIPKPVVGRNSPIQKVH